jgi:hypothetical protein
MIGTGPRSIEITSGAASSSQTGPAVAMPVSQRLSTKKLEGTFPSGAYPTSVEEYAQVRFVSRVGRQLVCEASCDD